MINSSGAGDNYILSVVNDTSSNDNDVLYGGAGDDMLLGSSGDNTLDGGTGTDTIWSGTGSDTIVIRSGDGSTTLTDADVLKDFSDGTDVIGMSSVAFDDLTIAQGTGDYASHTLISVTATGEYLLVLENTSASNVTVVDFVLNTSAAQTLSGSNSDNTLIGGLGGDTITTGSGTDNVLGHAGNDTITVDGSGVKTVDGGAGTDSLTISYTGITSLNDFTISQNGDYIVLTDSNSNSVSYKNIESLTVGS